MFVRISLVVVLLYKSRSDVVIVVVLDNRWGGILDYAIGRIKYYAHNKLIIL